MLNEPKLCENQASTSKPSINKDIHYLIFTPFRYPPLKYGSRFGRAFEPSLWYGSLQLKTAFAEVAYYRLRFFHDTEANLGYLENKGQYLGTQQNWRCVANKTSIEFSRSDILNRELWSYSLDDF